MIGPPIPAHVSPGGRARAWFMESRQDAAFVPEDAMRVARENGLAVVREFTPASTRRKGGARPA